MNGVPEMHTWCINSSIHGEGHRWSRPNGGGKNSRRERGTGQNLESPRDITGRYQAKSFVEGGRLSENAVFSRYYA